MPLSTLQASPRDDTCKTQGQDGVAFPFPAGLFHPLQHAGLARRTPRLSGALCVDGVCQEQRQTVLTIERAELVMETLGMSLGEGKAMLSGVQDVVIAQQAREYLEQQRACPDCGRLHTSKDAGTTAVKTVFGSVPVANPRWNCCSCQSAGQQTYRPMRKWLKERTSPEMMYLETKWGLLIPFAKVADLLCDVLPVNESVNAETVRAHLQAVAERMEEELGEERQGNLFEGSEGHCHVARKKICPGP